MTDKEIMKALECCCERGLLSESCDECPNLAMGSLCMDQMLRDVIDLINRQQAEIERLSKENNRFADIGKMYSEVKTEAIKEFAERLKAKRVIHYCKHCGKEIDYTDVFNDGIDTILKEMVGEE